MANIRLSQTCFFFQFVVGGLLYGSGANSTSGWTVIYPPITTTGWAKKKGAFTFSSPNRVFLPVDAHIFRRCTSTWFVNSVQISERLHIFCGNQKPWKGVVSKMQWTPGWFSLDNHRSERHFFLNNLAPNHCFWPKFGWGY